MQSRGEGGEGEESPGLAQGKCAGNWRRREAFPRAENSLGGELLGVGVLEKQSGPTSS